jgi:S1-C subfamily serine protease
VNGDRVATVAELFASLEDTRPGDQARLTVLRAGQRQEVVITLGERPRR